MRQIDELKTTTAVSTNRGRDTGFMHLFIKANDASFKLPERLPSLLLQVFVDSSCRALCGISYIYMGGSTYERLYHPRNRDAILKLFK